MTSPAPGSATEGREQDCRPDSYGEWPPLFARSSLLAAGGRHWEQTRELGLPRQQWLLTAEALQNAEPGQRTRFRQCARDVRRNSRGHVSRGCALQRLRPRKKIFPSFTTKAHGLASSFSPKPFGGMARIVDSSR